MAFMDKMREGIGKLTGGYGATQGGDAPKTDPEAKCVEFIEQLYKDQEDLLAPLHRQWYEQITWVYGEQYYEFDTRISRWIIRPERSYVPRATANLIIDLAERAVAVLGKGNITGHVTPEGTGPADYGKARKAEEIRKALWRDDRMDLKMRLLDVWCVYTGNAIAMTSLDSSGKQMFPIPKFKQVPLMNPETGEPEIDPETGAPAFEMAATDEIDKEIPLSEVSTVPVNPMEIIPDPHATDPTEMRYWLHHRSVEIDELADQYGSEIRDLVKPDTDMWASQQYQHKLLDLMTRASYAGQTYGVTSAVRDSKVQNASLVKTFYRLPCRDYPQGEILVRAGGHTLEFGPYPFISKSGKAYRNIHWYGWSVIPGCIWRFGLIRNLMDPQKRINGMLTQAGLNRKTMGNKQWLAPKGSGFSDEGTNRPGAVLLWTPKPKLRGTKPEQLQPTNMPADFWRELEVTVGHMDRISGMNDILRGENPPGVSAGVSLELLGEQAATRYQPAIAERRHEIRNLEEFRLFLVGRSPAWAVGKKMFVRDDDGLGQLVELTNLDTLDDPTIEMEEGTALIWTDAAKKANVGKLLENQLIDVTIPENRRLLRDEFGGSEYKDKFSADIGLAEFENQEMLEGRRVRVRPFENAMLHLAVHRRLTLRPLYYQEFPEAVRLAIELHIAETQDKVSQMAQDLEDIQKPSDAEAPPPMGAPGAPGEGPPGGGGGGLGGEAPGGEEPPAPEATEQEIV